MRLNKNFAVGVALLLTLMQATGASASSLNVETCSEPNYSCVNGGSAGATGYSGSDGPYGYDVGENGAWIPHNCTSYVAFRFNQIMGAYDSRYNMFGNASEWGTRVLANVPGSSYDVIPRVGDIAQWDYGHVAWVDRVELNASGDVLWFAVSDDNYYRKVTTRKKIYPGGPGNGISWPDHFIRLPIFDSGGGGLAGGGGHYVAMSVPLYP
jgi:surface antigen